MAKEPSAKCSACGRPLPLDHTGPCPDCGETGTIVSLRSVSVATPQRVKGRLVWTRVLREYWAEDRPKKITLAAILGILLCVVGTILGVVLKLGLIASIALAVVLALVGVFAGQMAYLATYKVREIERGG